MKRCAWGFTAVVLMSAAGTSAFAQTSSGAKCAGSVDASGTFTPASAGGCDHSSQAPAPSGYGAGSAIGSAFVDWLLTPSSSPYAGDPQRQRAIQQARQRHQHELQRRDSESLRLEQDNAELSSSLKGIDAGSELAAKTPGDSGTLSAQDARTLESLKHQVRAIDCAMADVYQATKTLGTGGAAFAEALNRDVLELEARLANTAPTDGKNVFDIGTVSRDSMHEGGGSGAQMVANAVVSRHVDTGETVIMVSYSAGKGKAKEGQSVMRLDRDGNVACQQLDAAAARCMKRYNPAYAAAAYCPSNPGK